MKTAYKKQKRNYTKPQVEQIKLDNEISVFMVSPPGDPTFSSAGSINKENNSNDPFKFTKA
jgi:secreted Zn-dependent insulinase-like peptidase